MFHEAAHNLADIMEKYSVDDLKVAYLQVIRYEKDFNRTKELVNKIKWDDALNKYGRLLQASNGDIKSIKLQQKGLEVYKVNKENYLAAVNKSKKIRNTFKNSTLSEDKIKAVNSQIKSYRNAFESLVTNTDKLNINVERTYKIVKEIERAGLKIEDMSESIITRTSKSATEKLPV